MASLWPIISGSVTYSDDAVIDISFVDITLPAGTHDIELRVTDDQGNTGSASVIYTIQ